MELTTWLMMTIQVGVSWSIDVQISTTQVIDGLVVDHERTV